MKTAAFWFKFHWNLFPCVPSTICHHCFRQWLGAEQAASHYLKHDVFFLWWIYKNFRNHSQIVRNHSQRPEITGECGRKVCISLGLNRLKYSSMSKKDVGKDNLLHWNVQHIYLLYLAPTRKLCTVSPSGVCMSNKLCGGTGSAMRHIEWGLTGRLRYWWPSARLW